MTPLRDWAAAAKRETLTLYYAARDPRTPWYAKWLAAAVAAYALSPIDLIPDFIPVIGYLDDALLVPLGLWIVLKLVPAEVYRDARRQAEAAMDRPRSRTAAAVIILVWLAAAIALGVWLLEFFQ